MNLSLELFASLLVLAVLICIRYILKANEELRNEKAKRSIIENKYSKIIDIDLEVDKSRKEKEEIENDIIELRESYTEKRKIFEGLLKEISIYDEDIQLVELGFYKPHFGFDTSEKFKEELINLKQEQKELISSKKAIYAVKTWTVDGSESEGRKMANRAIKLTSRAFNNECEAAVSNVRWNNVYKMEKRIEKAFDVINELNGSNSVVISEKYLKLKLKELRLTYEYANKKQQEKEEQQEIKRQMREEAKLEQEMDKAAKEEEKYNKLLEKAQKEAEKATGAKLEELQGKIALLNQELVSAHEKTERAKSMAEQTKRGHVYVISNIGSFGDSVYKIGMTRRLEPLDRVKELGDASVPFTFDVHAMIYSDNAPELENALHKKFDQSRLNLVNNRKEFFRVSLSDIENEVKKISPNAEFIETAEARDYRESLSIIAQRETATPANDLVVDFPEAI